MNHPLDCFEGNGGCAVLGQIGQSLDGRIAGPNGERRLINGAEGIAHLHRLRAMVDAVIIGVGTALNDDPQLTVRRVPGRNPARVVIDPHRRLPASARLFNNDGVRRLIVTRAREPAMAGVEIAVIDGDAIAPRHIIDELARRGLKRLLVEGGARTLAHFMAAGCLDRLHVLVAPVTFGAGPRSIVASLDSFASGDAGPQAACHRLGDDVLYDINLRAARPGHEIDVAHLQP
jgi:riboflavin-specific deaminase-like protein